MVISKQSWNLSSRGVFSMIASAALPEMRLSSMPELICSEEGKTNKAVYQPFSTNNTEQIDKRTSHTDTEPSSHCTMM
jgi:hypothetical protein